MDKKKINVIFMGTPEISAKILEGIFNDGYNIIGVISEPDKPVGRKQELLPTPVKKFAQEKGLDVYQPKDKNDLQATTYKLQADLIIVAAYGKILPKEVLDVPKHGCINFHASILPALRGASPVQTAILQGLDKTGVTIMIMDEGMDTGPILLQVEVKIDKTETTTTLLEKMLNNGLPLLLKTIPEYIDGVVKPTNQKNDKATYCQMIKKEDGKIDFSKPAEEEERKLRAYNIWPGVYCFWGEKRLKFMGGSTSLVEAEPPQSNGEVFLDDKNNLCIKFAEGCWIVNTLQLEGEKAISAKDFLNGHKDIVGSVLS